MNGTEKNDIRKQIKEDIDEYKIIYSNQENIQKDEWAFNWWILDKFFMIDEDVIPDNITDYNDKSIDSYVWHEELKNLYLIQNKYYDDNTNVTSGYVNNDFLTRSIGSLEKGSYTRNRELQKIFTKFKDDPDFHVYLYLYVTNNNKDSSVLQAIQQFNDNNSLYTAKIFYLDDISEQYYGEPPVQDKINLTVKVTTINKHTTLNINNKAYGTNQAIDARYALLPVNNIYEIYEKAKNKGYQLFDKNIREYLGTNVSVNKKIINTLNDEKDRVNFFYYNNGITIICDKLSTVTPDGKNRSTFEITNPQIVNGCQTVNSIVEVLDSKSDEYRNAEFQNTYVMAKILVLDATDEAKQDLYQKIVKYNNSQNAINEKSFIALSELFLRIQKEFMEKGFILCIKQSDKNKYKALYKNPKELLDRSARLRERFGLNLTKTNDFLIDLEKLLQVCLAFCDSGVAAFQKKNQLLVKDSKYNDEVVDFIQSVTTQTLLNLYLLYLRSEQTKKEKNNKNPKVPVSFYLIDCYGHYECGGDSNKILKMIQDKDSINHLIKIYKIATAEYLRRHINDKEGNSYTSMNKLPIDYNRMTECRLNAINALEDAE